MRTKTRRRIQRLLAAAILAAAMTAASGCFLVAVGAAGAAGAGTVAYVRGELDASVGSPYDRVVSASDAAVGQLLFVKTRESRDALDTVFEARTAEDKKVTIKVSKEGDNLCRVEIRVGFFGDEAKSRAIFEKIRAGA